jgi:hypothetical protein
LRLVWLDFAAVQAENGVQAHRVLRSNEDPKNVTITHTFDSSRKPGRSMGDEELKDAMTRAGVQPDSLKVSYFDEAEAGALIRLVSRSGAGGAMRHT